MLSVRRYQRSLAAREVPKGLESPVGSLGFVFQSVAEFLFPFYVHGWIAAALRKIRRPLKAPPQCHPRTHTFDYLHYATRSSEGFLDAQPRVGMASRIASRISPLTESQIKFPCL